MKITRKQLIINKYSELIKELNEYIPDNTILPDTNEIDCADLLFFFSMTFTNNEQSNKDAVRNLIEMNYGNIDDDKFNKVYQIIDPFLKWFSNLK